MNWTHALTALVVLLIGYWIGSKYPGLIGRATGGVVSA
jgi:hypothetical protein